MQRVNVAVFRGDGIGPDVMDVTTALLDQVAAGSGAYTLHWSYQDAGAATYLETGSALPDAALEAARQADAILLSAMGLPAIRYEDGTEIRPQIDLRLALDLFAGVRPVTIRPGMPSPLRLPTDRIVDFVLLRESTEGLFHSMDRGEVTEDTARETLQITREGTRRLTRFAIDLARSRKARGLGPGRVTCVDKANVFRAFAFFREVFDAEMAAAPDLAADHAYVDAMALWMVQRPWDFDVLVTENMFGDILSDLGAGLMGGLGLAPSADIGADHAVFQPCHGSAPDIAGQGVANPMAMILSGAMMLDWLSERLGVPALAADGARLRDAVYAVLAEGRVRTPDMGGSDGTEDVARAVAAAL